MINELYKLSESMGRADVQTQTWHINYKPIPNISANAPCVCVMISGGKVIKLSAIPNEIGVKLRKFGNNQGTYPCMNLAPLYRLTDATVIKALRTLRPENIDSAKVEEIRSWCQSNNWRSKFLNKYKICMDKSKELLGLIPSYQPLQILVEESDYFLDPMTLHQHLETEVFRMLHSRENISLAFQILFYQGKDAKEAYEDYGSLSIAFESPRLIDMGIPSVSSKFTIELNEALLLTVPEKTKQTKRKKSEESIVDAFGVSFMPIGEPMPTVKLAGGFDVTLRTMFHGHPCQTRYGRIEDASYPISLEMRKRFQTSLDWLASAERENITWMKIDKNEILFAYPAQIPEMNISYVKMFGKLKENATFTEQAKQFLAELRHCREIDVDSRADRVQLFILKKIDKARVKVVYTRQTDAHELEKCSEAWTLGCANLPVFAFGELKALFPLDISDILNRFWKQNGDSVTEKCKPVSKYHGLELLMESGFPITTDIHVMSEKAMMLGAFLGGLLTRKDWSHPIWNKIKEMLALLGLLLYRKSIRKETYMESFPYLYGQLLKVSDELHAMYCEVVRKGDLPLQLAGSCVYQAAAEAPLRTLSVLGQRMNPYITWAKTYHPNEAPEKGKENWRAKWLLRTYEDIAGRLFAVWQPDTRFSDEEKAQLFIGYLASFPKREQNEEAE